MSNNSVQLLGYYGGDERICLSAWQSTNIELDIELGEIQNRIKELFDATVVTKKKSPAELLKFLAEHNHGTPFEKGILDFQITGDIASHIHAIKHRHSSINCESARYKEINDKYYLPNDWKNISINTEDINLLKLNPQIKDFLIETLQAHKAHYTYTWLEILEEFTKLSHQLYHLSCEQLTPKLGRKRAKESSRYFLPYNTQLDYDWQMNFRSFVNIQQLRNSEFAQEEIHYITNTMLYLVETIPNNPFKYSLEAFNLKSDPKYILN